MGQKVNKYKRTKKTVQNIFPTVKCDTKIDKTLQSYQHDHAAPRFLGIFRKTEQENQSGVTSSTKEPIERE